MLTSYELVDDVAEMIHAILLERRALRAMLQREREQVAVGLRSDVQYTSWCNG